MDAYQYFFDAEGNQTGYQPVGHFHWDAKPTHQHWHFKDFARYTLLREDMTQVARSKKEAFCLANTDFVDATVPGAAWRPENDRPGHLLRRVAPRSRSARCSPPAGVTPTRSSAPASRSG